MYLLDTDMIIYILKGHPAVTKNLRRHLHDPIKISVVNLMELYYGAYKSRRVTSNLAKIKRLETELEILPIETDQTEIFAIQKAKLEQVGMRLADFDLILASCALSHNLTLVTNNIKHLQRIEGLKLENWAVENPPD